MIWVGQTESQQSFRVSESGRWHYGNRLERKREEGRSEDSALLDLKMQEEVIGQQTQMASRKLQKTRKQMLPQSLQKDTALRSP